jgi:hypothetical protein
MDTKMGLRKMEFLQSGLNCFRDLTKLDIIREYGKEQMEECCKKEMFKKHHHHHNSSGGSSAIYGLGVVGALFYFLQGASTFGMVMMGIGKAFFWPAILMYKLLTYLQM